MFAFVLQNLTSLLLAGVLVYVVYASDRLRNKRPVQQMLLGIIFGVMVMSLGMNSISFKIIPTQFDAKAGPLIFAGYLGGPIGAVIAGACGALYRYSQGGAAVNIGIFMNLATPAIGVAVYYLRPARNWPVTSKSTAAYLMLALALLHIVPLWYLSRVNQDPDAHVIAAQVAVGFASIGVLSTLVTWQVLNYAFRFANVTVESADSVKKLDLAMQMSGMGMFDQKKDSLGPFFDEGLMSIYGLDRPAGQVLMPEWEALIHPEDLPRLQRERQQMWQGTQTLNKTNFRVQRSDGTLRYIRASWIADLAKDGTTSRIIGMHADLTDIRDSEKLLQDSRNRLEHIIEKLPGVALEVDGTGPDGPKLLYISPKCHKIWGVTDQEFYADPSLLMKMHDPDDIEKFLKVLYESFETGEPIFHRYKITTRDGQTRWLDYHGGTDIEKGRALIKAIILDATTEVEAQKKMERESEISRRAQKNESIGQLTGGVAHDFNNLLAVILGNLELLSDRDVPPVEQDLIDTAITATLRGADLTKNMLAFARQAPLTPVVLDLNSVVREAKNWIGRTLPESVNVETSLLAGLWPVKADRASLESALLNLTLNARDAMEGHGNLTIETANVRIDQAYIDARNEELAPGRYVMLAVSDTGPGISQDTLASIFEPFFTTKPPGLGSGLGLSMTDGFMRQSGGTVQVYTEIDQGTTFKLYFPATNMQQEQITTPEMTDHNPAHKGHKLLVAEDEKSVRETLVKVLEHSGYHVTATASGDAAFATFEADPTFDLLLTDIVMPGKLQGTTLAKALRARWPALPVIFMSGYASEATVHGNGLRPEDIRMMKPVQRTDLLDAVAKVLS
ncbi:PAS domain-containing protein [Pacificibacter marinus]|uniref:histidine kinase n=1 Tax=Pacificibacter marinus TaxID=658057 RepID=A0A1Y5RTP8_9RHOB|nr:PAS domain-containing protein [Pacificibacter marinus]SEK40880.1 PAS domain S-box-containing protein [Pacificibacter marinus]SLN24971.1 Blue-light-activated protein [Pacificibacter marinus]